MPDSASLAQLLLQFSPDALLAVDARGIIQYANETASSLFGYPRAELVGKPIEQLVPERFHIRHGAHVAQYLKHPSNREMGARISDLFARRADGSEFPAGIRLTTFRAEGHFLVAAAIRDMTERRAINDALVSAREEADRANRAKSRFLATASHDLRQPLQTVRLLNASLLKMSEQSAPLKELLLRQESAINNASRLLNALLDISRLESGAIEADIAPARLNAVYGDLRQEFDAQAHGKGLNLFFPQTERAIRTDRILLTQLLQNLIGNALKYTERGEVRVLEYLDAESLVISVEDTGIGIPEEKLDRIFDEYYQVGPQGTQRLGVGLGLAIVREVARILGYSVAVFSSLGKGTEVQLRIPLLHLAADTPTAPVPEGAVTPNADSRGRIVLLEDNDSVRAATELFLGLEGFEVQSAATVAEAETLLSKMAPSDILVTDYHLEGSLTGLDVLHEVRRRQGRDVPAVLLSGDLQSIMRMIKSPLSRVRFLSKPVDTRALIQAIGELGAEEMLPTAPPQG
jgi:PAS domain S-box-containing protein